RHKPTDGDDLTMTWMCEEVDPFTLGIRNFKSSRAARVWFDELPPESIDSYKDHKAAFLAYFMQQKKYVKDPVEIHNIKQKDGETIEDFMERFKVETGRMKGALECMQISGFMHGVNNPELTKRLNEHVPKTMEEMMITTTAFIRREAVVASKKKGHTSWRTQDQSKRKTPKKRTPKEILATEAGKFRPSPPMVTPVEKRSSNKFCDFHNDKGHSTDECMQLKKQIEELVRADKLSHLIKEIKHGRDQSKVGKKETPAKDKPTTIYMIQSPGIKEIQVVPSTAHGMLMFLADGGIVIIRSTILIPVECATVITSSEVPKEAGVRHENFKVALHPNFLDQEMEIGGTLSAKGRTKLCSLLKENLDIFAWNPSDMKGVPRSVAEHRLNIRGGYSPSQMRRKRLSTPAKGCIAIQKMPFDLKNAAATYQRLVNKTFDSQIGRNIEVYIDDLVINSHTEAEMLRDIGETFRTLRKINMKLNPQKCTYGAVEGMFLGYMITPKGIKPCPDKTEVVLQLPSLRTIKEVQSLNGKLASLNRFLSKSAEKSFSLFKTLKKCIKKSDFHWTSEAEQAFKQLKQHLSELTLLVASKPKEELIVYMFAPYGAISAVLMTEREMVQIVMLGEHNITYHPRTSVKGHVLADFLAEMPDESPPDALVVETQQEPWTLFTDGSSCVDGSGAGLILTRPEGTKFTYALRFQFAASNNETEYEALIAGLRIAAHMGVQNVHVSVDSNLVANQVIGAYVAKEENMIKYPEKVKSLVLVEILKEKPIQEKEVTTVIEEDGLTWMTPIMKYLKERTLPSDRKEVRKLCIKARQYDFLEGVLYRRSFLMPWLRPGDFVYRSNDASHAVDGGKLGPKWE
nr:hypothetical protein [Tanacetum cinerariifolium]